ncbi:T9SS type A sorting domain-containing protein [bacterium]|nr:T9SS type A sorting domain-containing protein [bacterium]
MGKKLYFLLVLAGCLSLSAVVNGAEVVIPPSDGTTYLNEQIATDQASAGDPDRVYVLQRNGIYMCNGVLTNTGWVLRIKAEDGDGKIPLCYLVTNAGTGTFPSHFIEMGEDVILQNIGLVGFVEELPGQIANDPPRLIRSKAAGFDLILDGCLITSSRGEHIRLEQATRVVKITNCIFGNMGDLGTSNLGAGKPIDFRDASCDSAIFLNNTFVNFQDRIIRHRASKAPIRFFQFEHNTAYNSMGYHGTIALGWLGDEAIIKDNLFIDTFIAGADTDKVRQSEFNESGELDARNGLGLMTWVISVPNDTTEWTVSGNYYSVSPEVQAFYDLHAAAGVLGEGPPLTAHILGRLGVGSINAFTKESIELTEKPAPMVNLAEWYRLPAGGNKTKNTPNAWWNRETDDYDRRLAAYYLDTLDCSYPTGTMAYSGGENGFPAGDLNWFPDMKAIWEQGIGPMDLVVVNPSFELPGTAKIKGWDGPGSCSDPAWAGATDDIPGWSADAQAFDSGVEQGPATDGTWTAFMKSGDPQVYQTLTRRIQAGETFLLRVDAQNTWQATDLKLVLYYVDGGAKVTAAEATVPVTGSMQTFSLLFKSDDVPAAVGKQIGIGFENVSPEASSWIGLDQVMLDLVTNQIVVDGNKDPFFHTLTGPDDGYLQIRSYAASDNGAPVDDADLSAKIWTAWDAEWFYLYEEVMDDTLSGSATNVWEEDEIELKIDPQPTDSTANSVWDTRLTALDMGEGDVVAADNLNSVAGAADKQWARKIIPGGYALELAFKWSVVKSGAETITPAVDEIFGAGINQHDNDGAAKRQASITWAAALKDAIYNTPKYHGTVKFLPDNKLQFIPRNNVTGLTNPVPYDGSDYTPSAADDLYTVPLVFNLDQNYPNPFNPSTRILFSIDKPGRTTLSVFNMRGQKVAELLSADLQPGMQEIVFDASHLANGVYIYRLESGDRVQMRKMVLMK